MSPDESTVSVVIPLYQGEMWIHDCIASVLAQTRGRLEVVVIDDGSRDAGPGIVAGIRDSRVRLHRQENQGIAAARNEGIRRSRGGLVAFLDQDDLWRPEKLERQVPVFSDPRVGLVHCQADRIDGRGRVLSGGPLAPPSWLAGDVRERMLVGNVVPGTAGVVVRRECFETLGLFDETLYGTDDWDMWARIAASYRFAYVPETLCSTRLHDSNTSHGVERMRADSLRVQERLLADRRLTSDIGPRRLARLRARGRARIHAYCATWLLRSGRFRDAAKDLAQAVRLQPTKPRHWVLLLCSVVGWLPPPVRRRMI